MCFSFHSILGGEVLHIIYHGLIYAFIIAILQLGSYYRIRGLNLVLLWPDRKSQVQVKLSKEYKMRVPEGFLSYTTCLAPTSRT